MFWIHALLTGLLFMLASGERGITVSHSLQANAEGAFSSRVEAALRRELARHGALYHRLAEPEISDAAYDQMIERLADLDGDRGAQGSGPHAENPAFDDRIGRFPDAAHRVPMRSLRKVYTLAELGEVYWEHVDRLGEEELAYRVEPKVDGMAVSVVYEAGRLRRILTRGNGEVGEDLTRNFRALGVLPETLGSPGGQALPDYLELRGEAYIPKAAFARLNKERLSRGEEPFRHPRNLAVGTARLEDSAEAVARGLAVVLFDAGAWEPEEARPADDMAFRQQLQVWNLPVLEAGTVVRGWEELAGAVEILGRERTAWPYAADGIVIKLLRTEDRLRLGMTSDGPAWAVAWKFRTEHVSTRLLGITWQVGETGVLTPVAELEAVEMSGRVIRRATLHNRDFLLGGDYRVGDTVFLHLAGDVIPQLLGVDFSRRKADATVSEIPVRCPHCHESLEYKETRVAIRCLNPQCPGRP